MNGAISLGMALIWSDIAPLEAVVFMAIVSAIVLTYRIQE
jgi:hypothetical protein